MKFIAIKVKNMVYITINWFSNKAKKVLQYLFILVTMGVSGMGVLNYFNWKEKIDPFEINGG